jgi:hypothetical protein
VVRGLFRRLLYRPIAFLRLTDNCPICEATRNKSKFECNRPVINNYVPRQLRLMFALFAFAQKSTVLPTTGPVSQMDCRPPGYGA